MISYYHLNLEVGNEKEICSVKRVSPKVVKVVYGSKKSFSCSLEEARNGSRRLSIWYSIIYRKVLLSKFLFSGYNLRFHPHRF